jgi:hypothetical protein
MVTYTVASVLKPSIFALLLCRASRSDVNRGVHPHVSNAACPYCLNAPNTPFTVKAGGNECGRKIGMGMTCNGHYIHANYWMFDCPQLAASNKRVTLFKKKRALTLNHSSTNPIVHPPPAPPSSPLQSLHLLLPQLIPLFIADDSCRLKQALLGAGREGSA